MCGESFQGFCAMVSVEVAMGKPIVVSRGFGFLHSIAVVLESE